MKTRGIVVLGMAAALSGASLQLAHARSGQAAYHLHTGAMVTAARYEPRGSVLRVTNPQNGRTVTVLVNDRGPFNGNRILDLSTGAFRALFGGLGRGVGPISYEVVSRGGNDGFALASRGGRRYGSSRGKKRGWSKRKRKTRRSSYRRSYRRSSYRSWRNR